eukprot:CAMPEP_0198679960 /NCGR_PEP_ID=MMETSP1468-20131203/3724_1 /TAXON_ID=1461545 /ORGANISM="Mantoniella sp, Strain CCMP1436" /LENGTH=66 /DNA_ID=CAMNT_0044419381 /DNA_START=647 /DNA_END=847 /DNA_ORIENTATION=+
MAWAAIRPKPFHDISICKCPPVAASGQLHQAPLTHWHCGSLGPSSASAPPRVIPKQHPRNESKKTK